MFKAAVVTMGELMLRLSAPGRELLLQSPRFDAHFGGAEANVAVALARLGTPARFVTTLPTGALGDAALAELRAHGVDVAHIARADGRLGLYFLAMGAGPRASDVIYDRAGSTFARAGASGIDWSHALDGASWLHVSGVTLALSESAERSAMAAIDAARAMGLKVSFDCNFRARLWEARGAAPAAILDAVLARTDLVFADYRDVRLLTGEDVATDDPAATRRAAAHRLFDRFPQLSLVAGVTRAVESHDCQTLTAGIYRRDGKAATSRAWRLTGIVDRVGGGDAFAAGLLHAVAGAWSLQSAIDFAATTGALKHSIPGDIFRLDEAMVRHALGGASDIQR
jgi:2-dehydro-3-deoxygluconokinase